MTNFVAGDRVNVAGWGAAGTVRFGPFVPMDSTRRLSYLVESDIAEALSMEPAMHLSAATRFAAGDTVRATWGTGDHKVVAGPFAGSESWYVLRDGGGLESPCGESCMTPAVAKPARTFALDGTIFELDKRYADQDGDAWEFTNGLDEDDKTPIMRLSTGPYGSMLRSLSDVVRTWGPLMSVDAD